MFNGQQILIGTLSLQTWGPTTSFASSQQWTTRTSSVDTHQIAVASDKVGVTVSARMLFQAAKYGVQFSNASQILNGLREVIALWMPKGIWKAFLQRKA